MTGDRLVGRAPAQVTQHLQLQLGEGGPGLAGQQGQVHPPRAPHAPTLERGQRGIRQGRERRFATQQGLHRRDDVFGLGGFRDEAFGTDLAGLRTKAEDKGDHFLINGQKVWTSYADKADWIFCLVRTDKTNKYQGISFLLFDMESPGVSTKPILLISGNSPFCETFFDDVEVPKTQFVGEINRGWDVAKYLLGHEREMISGGGAGGDMVSVGGHFAKSLGLNAQGELDDPILRAEMAAFDVDVFAYRAMGERFMDMWKTGRAHPANSNMMKYVGTELNKRRHELVMSGGGSEALEWDSEETKGGARARGWLRTKANSIEGGTSEVMLNVIAKRILDLPGA